MSTSIPEVFEAEMERIFMRTWVYVGHDSEIAEPGDYKMTSVGKEPVLLSRGEDGAPHVVINRCSHRGAAVCLMPRGNVSGFRCQFHGWTFGLDGKLVGDSLLRRGGLRQRGARR